MSDSRTNNVLCFNLIQGPTGPAGPPGFPGGPGAKVSQSVLFADKNTFGNELLLNLHCLT